MFARLVVQEGIFPVEPVSYRKYSREEVPGWKEVNNEH